jgi:TRAP-type mannitol/chloroaromatic compound transport system permease small subunit
MSEERTVERTRSFSFKKLWIILDHWFERFTSICLSASGIFVLIMAFTVFYGVIRRYFFRSPDNNAYLVVLVLMLACSVLALAQITRNNRNIIVDFFGQYFHPKVRMVISHIAAPILGLIFCGTLAWKSWDTAAFSLYANEKTVTVAVIPVFPLRAMIVFGVILVSLTLVVQLILGISSFIKGNTSVAK